MNSVHDMGGMDGMGPIAPEIDEPVFHARWEGRMFALDRAVRGKWNSAMSRYQMELIGPAEYLRMSYYEKRFTATTALLIKVGLVTSAELDRGRPARNSKKGPPLPPAANVAALVTKGVPASR